MISKKTQEAIEVISGGWCWDNYRHEGVDDCQDKGGYWTVFEALGCKLSWLDEFMETVDDEEMRDIVKDTREIIVLLQNDLKF
jgi:hypothetical protein